MEKARKLMMNIKNYIFDIRFTPVVLLLLCLLGYGIFIPATGFFIDDWYIMWFKHVFGAWQFPMYFALDRPFMGYFYSLSSYLLLGSESPQVWGFFAVILRWLSTFALWGMLKTIWPKAEQQNRAVVLLAAVFPGFIQHWFVVIYSYFYACLALFFLSITLMLKAVREPKKFWVFYPLSILLGFYSMASEFFFGLELVRPVILYIEFARREKLFGKRVVPVLKYWAAFLVYFIGFGIWRFFFFVSMNHAVRVMDVLKGNLFGKLISGFRTIYQSFITSTISSWANLFSLSNYPDKGEVSILIPGVIVLVFLGLLVWLNVSRSRKGGLEKKESSWGKEAILASLFALIVAGIPFYAAGLKIDHLGFDSRYLLAFLFGSCLLVVLALESFSSWARKSVFIFSLLTSVAVGYQIANANYYKNIWVRQREFYWQLNWRIPGLQPGTTLLTYKFPSESEMYSGNAITAQLNWTYQSDIVNREVDYQFIILDSGQSPLIKSLEKNIPITVDFRTFVFKGNTSKSIYLVPPSPGCLRILDQEINPPETVIWKFDLVPYDPIRKSILASSALTDLNLILNEGMGENHPPYQILGSENPHTWCYYFEKAELARQFGEYGRVLSLLSEATAQGYFPKGSTEWYPFIDAYARTGDWQNAKRVTTEIANNGDVALTLGLCHLWEKLSMDFTDPGAAQMSAEMVNNALQCEK
jgi:hypothetical protein